MIFKKRDQAEADGRRKIRKKRKVRSIVLAWCLVIVTVAVIAFSGFKVFVAMGYRSLKNNAVSSGPSLDFEDDDQDAEESASTGESVSVVESQPPESVPEESKDASFEESGGQSGEQAPEEDEVISVPWESDWVRYNKKVYDYNEDILTFLFLGIDKEDAVEHNTDLVSGGQADAIFLAVLNPDTKKISLIGINRDTMVEIRMVGVGDNGEDRYTTAELSVQHGFGDGMHQSCELTRDAVSKLFYGLPIHGYVSFNMGGIGPLNDALGGVTLNVLEDMTAVNPAWTQGAEVTLMGQDAYTYIRYRDTTVFESARNRLARQKQYLSSAAAAALAGTKQNLAFPLTLYQTFQPYIVTDLTADRITYLASVISGYKFDANAIYTLEGTTVTNRFEEFYPDKKALKKLVIRLFYREVDPVTGKYITSGN